MTRPATLALALLAAPADAAPIDWITDPVTGLTIGLTGERIAPETGWCADTKGGPSVRCGLTDLTLSYPVLPRFTCPAWYPLWSEPVPGYCVPPAYADAASVWAPEPPRLWWSTGRRETVRVWEDCRCLPPREPETPAPVPLPAAGWLLTAAVAAMWRRVR